MTLVLLFVLGGLAFAGGLLYRRACRTPEPPHTAATCPHCCRLRHPANRATRTALASLPRQRDGAS